MSNPYQLALAAAKNELGTVQQEAKRLTLRVSQLEALVAQLDALISSSTPITPFFPEMVGDGVPALPANRLEAPQPLWKAIIAALNGKKGDFTVPDAIAALERTGRHIVSPNRVNIVRNTLIQNKAFSRIGSGHYRVIGHEEMPNEKEATEVTS
jgi:hypothetical protein